MKLRVIVAVFAFFCLCSPEAYGENWHFYCRYKDQFFYDIDNVNQPYEKFRDIVSVWQKTIYDQESIILISGHLGDKYSDLSEAVSLIEIDCAERYSQLKATTYYDSKGAVIATVTKSKDDWKAISSQTAPIERLYKTVCPRNKRSL